MSRDVIGDDAKDISATLKDGEVALLENVRYYKEETKNDPEFAKALASLADIFVNTPAFAHCCQNSCKIIICQHQMSRPPAYFRTAAPHGAAYVRGF